MCYLCASRRWTSPSAVVSAPRGHIGVPRLVEPPESAVRRTKGCRSCASGARAPRALLHGLLSPAACHAEDASRRAVRRVADGASATPWNPSWCPPYGWRHVGSRVEGLGSAEPSMSGFCLQKDAACDRYPAVAGRRMRRRSTWRVAKASVAGRLAPRASPATPGSWRAAVSIPTHRPGRRQPCTAQPPTAAPAPRLPSCGTARPATASLPPPGGTL
jgi:hypothetical protein